MTPVSIIHLPPAEWQRYRDIRLESLRQEPQAFGSTVAEMEMQPPDYWQGRLREAEQADKSWLLFAEQDGKLVGMIGAYYDGREDNAHIVSVYVSPSARGRGVGQSLMAAILAEVSRKAGIRKAILGVNQEQAAAVRLYRRFGFVVTAEKEVQRAGGELHRGYEMEKPLQPSS